MKSLILMGCALLAAALLSLGGCNREPPQKPEALRTQPVPMAATSLEERLRTGEVLFKQNCASCHPDGGNVTDPRRTLRGPALKANHITTPEDIVRIMRHPVSRMIRFDETAITDSEATVIAEYILITFK